MHNLSFGKASVVHHCSSMIPSTFFTNNICSFSVSSNCKGRLLWFVRILLRYHLSPWSVSSVSSLSSGSVVEEALNCRFLSFRHVFQFCYSPRTGRILSPEQNFVLLGRRSSNFLYLGVIDFQESVIRLNV
ncbi:hypothetical protein CDAR_48341 [Caerostris darwini]|uniref:Uncharacterized protein n=1 Tax=Caerostris darwini TaxID=1538125 RepID=A0AAV4W542_9ARAC|nr:hypothetical protein CDAR_48341 [Caerostris darwini]